MRAAIVVLALLLSGCATCERHTIACTVATVIVAGSVAATIEAHQREHCTTLACEPIHRIQH